jgi:gliding motility-associated-like protein
MNTKTWFLFINFCLVVFTHFSQNTFIPDNNFEQALIDLGLDTAPLDNMVPTVNISGIVNLDVSGKNISDLTGIENFSLLENLDCSNNQLSQLNTSQNTNLIELFCFNNLLTNINVTKNTNLLRFWCHGNELTNLNITQNISLISFRCEQNNITTLNVSNNRNLIILSCQQNQIRSINISNNIDLDQFRCGRNLLSNLDVSNNKYLTLLSVEQNKITNIDLTNNSLLRIFACFENELTNLDLSENKDLTDLNCSSNKLCSLNIRNGNNNNINSMNFSLNPDLNCVVVDDPNGNHIIWVPSSFSNYESSMSLCGNFVPIDKLDNFVGVSYTLPVLVNGNYFTGPNGTGIQLNAGDVITTSQTLFIYNEIKCNNTNSSFSILIDTSEFFIPKYFTPNNDGFNDIWKVFDNANTINNISIFNRQGKLLKFLSGNVLGWDGTYNGESLGTDSYWYEIVLNSKEVLRGYFALKR